MLASPSFDDTVQTVSVQANHWKNGRVRRVRRVADHVRRDLFFFNPKKADIVSAGSNARRTGL